MRLQTKTSLAILPMVSLAILFLGTWSVITSTQGLRNSMELVMALELDDFMDYSLKRLHGVLEKNRLTQVASFVEKYQALALVEAQKIHYLQSARLLILDTGGRAIFRSGQGGTAVDSLWGDVAARIASQPHGEVKGELRTSQGKKIYVGRYFEPWRWSVIYAVSADEVEASARSIRNATFGVAGVCIVAGFLMIFFIFRNFLIAPVSLLKDAAKAIAGQEDVEGIDIRSRDELGELARSMEEMAASIQRYRIRQANWQNHLEAEIRARTEDLNKTNAALEISNKELDDFAYIASHDLKEPLRGIATYSAFLMEDYGEILDDDGRAKLETLIRLARREESLIESLLEYSRVGRTELAFEPVDLNAVVREVTEAILPSFDGEKIDIRVPEPLPVIPCDSVRINDVFYNLVANAVKYNDKPEKWVETGVETAVGEDAGQYIFYVKDNGIGIPEKHHKRIFTIFKRLHGRDKYGGGTGAGLTIVKKIVERHGGKIWVKSRPGEGTTFYFTLKQGEYHGHVQATDSDC